MQQRFPLHDEFWRRQVEAMILGLEHDVQSLQQTTPQIPDPEAGMAFTGPLSPVVFNYPKQAEQSGTPVTI